MDLLRDILASQQAGNASNFDGIDQYVKGAQAQTDLSKTQEDNRILSSREASNQAIANGDLVGALRNAQASGDLTYQNNLLNHINANRQTLGALAQNLTQVAPEHRQAALAAANNTLGGLDVDTSALNGADNTTLGALANSVIDPNDQIKNNQKQQGLGIDQQNANTNQYNSQTSRINSGIEQQNADTAVNRLGIEATHYGNADQADAYKLSHGTYTDENGNTYSYIDPDAPKAMPYTGPATLADRNNNPGNLVFAGQPGAQQTSSGYASFANPQDGIQANLNQINRDINVHGFNTIDSLVDHWASTSPADQRRAYKIALARQLNRGVNDRLTSDDASALLPSMARQEGYHGNLNMAPQATAPASPASQPVDVNQANAVDPTNPIEEAAPTAQSSTPVDNGPASTRMVTLPSGQQVEARLVKAGRRPLNADKQTDKQAQAGVNYDMAKAADAVMERAERNGDIPSQHRIIANLPAWYAVTGLPGSEERGKLNEYDNAARHFSQEANSLYHPQGGSQYTQEEQNHLVLVNPYDTQGVVNTKAAYRKNVMNDLKVRSTPAGKVTEQTLEPGFVNPTQYDARTGTTSAIPSQDDVNAVRQAVKNNDINTLNTFKQKYGEAQLDRFLNTL